MINTSLSKVAEKDPATFFHKPLTIILSFICLKITKIKEKFILDHNNRVHLQNLSFLVEQ